MIIIRNMYILLSYVNYHLYHHNMKKRRKSKIKKQHNFKTTNSCYHGNLHDKGSQTVLVDVPGTNTHHRLCLSEITIYIISRSKVKCVGNNFNLKLNYLILQNLNFLHTDVIKKNKVSK
jgi:hypothetical protein